MRPLRSVPRSLWGSLTNLKPAIDLRDLVITGFVRQS
jgi:hypothetical protein